MIPMGMVVRDAAYELFAAEGPEGLSMRKLGTRLGLSAAAIYKHVESRARLVDSVAATAFESMGTCLLRHSKVKPARAQIGAVTQDAIDFALANRHLFKLMFDEGRKRASAHEIIERQITMLIAQIDREEPGQLLDPIRPRELALGWLSLIIGAVALHRLRMVDEKSLRDLCTRSAGRILGLPYT